MIYYFIIIILLIVIIFLTEKIKNLKTMIEIDILTGLKRKEFLEPIFTNKRKKNNKKIGVVFIDIDNFKNINDQYGHLIGDKLLQLISKRISKTIREKDIIFRFGGDEIVLLLFDVLNKKSIEKIIKILIKKLSSPIILKNLQIKSTCSIGISIYPDNGRKLNLLIKKADSAMYHIKKSGKNNYCFYNTF